MNATSDTQWGRGHLVGSRLGLSMFCLLAIGCARLPVPVQVIHEDQRLVNLIEELRQHFGETRRQPHRGLLVRAGQQRRDSFDRDSAGVFS